MEISMKAFVLLCVASGTLAQTSPLPAPKIPQIDSSWYDSSQGSLLKILSGSALLAILGLIFWKVWEMKKGVEKSKELLNELEDQIDVIEEESEEFVVKSIKDIREGIIFFENPMRLHGYGDHNTKMQELHKKISKLKGKVKQGEKDLSNLKERNDWYKNEIKELTDEYERKKKENFDIGHALGYSDSLVRQYD